MKRTTLKLAILLYGIIGYFNTALADLNDLGNGLVNDTSLNITWMKDANLFKTLCGADNPLATDFTPVDTIDAVTVCVNNGAMTWNDAKAWISRLNTVSYYGRNDWRLPATTQPDVSCDTQFHAGNLPNFPEQRGGHRCTASELGILFNTSLANPNDGDDNCFNPPETNPNHCLQTTTPFNNAQVSSYWSDTTIAPYPADAWNFHFLFGFQSANTKDSNNMFVWPVRNGLSVVVPITPQQVPTLSLWSLGILSLFLACVARRQL